MNCICLYQKMPSRSNSRPLAVGMRLLIVIIVVLLLSTLFHHKKSEIESDNGGADDALYIDGIELAKAPSSFAIPALRKPFRNETPPFQLIPRVVYQTGFSRSVSERVYTNAMNGFRNNSLYAFRYFDNDAAYRFIQRRFGGRVSLAYSKLKMGAARADLWRYCVLFEKGGAYIDLDAGINGPFVHEHLNPNSEALLGHDNMGNLINWFMMFRRGHPLLRKVIRLSVERVLAGDKSVFTATGPTLFTDAFFLYFGKDMSLAAVRRMSPDDMIAFYARQSPRMVVSEISLNDMGIQFKYSDFEEHDLYELHGLRHYEITGGSLKITPELYFAAGEEKNIAAPAEISLWDRMLGW